MSEDRLKVEVAKAYGNRIRVRVGALIVEKHRGGKRVLLVQHDGLTNDAPFWTPPGGAIVFGESLTEALIREVEEETGLEVAVGPLRYVADYVCPPLHAVSFYFECSVSGGRLRTGADPELETQLIRSVAFIPVNDLNSLTVVPAAVFRRLITDIRHGYRQETAYLGTSR